MYRNLLSQNYIKTAIVLIGIVTLFHILYVGKEILIPIVFAVILAILLNPFVNYLMYRHVNRVFAILIALGALVVFVVALAYFITIQISMFSNNFPEVKVQLLNLVMTGKEWFSENFHISLDKIDMWLANAQSESFNNSTKALRETFITLSHLAVVIVLIPVYIFMILYYKPLLLEFISKLFPHEQHKVVAEVLLESRSLIQSYLVGLLLEAALVAILNSLGFLIIGLDYAILLGIICSLLNVIPYVGGLVGITLPIIMALAMQNSQAALWVVLVYLLVQFIDNNIIVPKIVASKVKINALVSIVVVLVGGAIWGISGMFLSLPLTAICKVIFDRIEPLKPYGFLLGDNQPKIGKVIFNFKKISSRRKTTVKKTPTLTTTHRSRGNAA